jgi:protoporphyrinogen oxidase
VQYIIIEQNLDVPNKLYELLEQICIRVEQTKQTTGMKYLYVPNKLYEMPEQICIHVC